MVGFIFRFGSIQKFLECCDACAKPVYYALFLAIQTLKAKMLGAILPVFFFLPAIKIMKIFVG